MKTFLRNILIVIGVFVVFLLVIPFLIPVPPIENSVNNPELLAEEQSKFIEINGIKVHYIEYGSGPETIILLHGFGASTFSWREVMEPLGKEYRVIAYDWIGFGLTERPMQGEWTDNQPIQHHWAIGYIIRINGQSGDRESHSCWQLCRRKNFRIHCLQISRQNHEAHPDRSSNSRRKTATRLD